MKFSFLIENKTDNPGVVAEHGLSIYIEAHDKRILFDAGATSLILQNAKNMKVDLASVDYAVISHGHYDHTGGIPAFCEINAKAPVYIHRNAFRKSYGYEKGVMDKETCGILWSDEELDAMEDRIVFTNGPMEITDDIFITGTVPVGEDFQPTERFSYYNEEGELVEDDLSHEQCLVIREPEGIYIFSGCSHRGVLNALECGKSMFPGERVAALIAGTHLYSATEEDRKRVVDEIAGEGLDKVMPVHCTGINAICDLKARLGDKCVVATAGDVFDGSDR